MIDSLRQERGQEKMSLNNASHRRPELASNSRPFTNPSTGTSTPSSSSATADQTLDLAKQHRDRLLAYQAENARRTTIVDEVADFETPGSGVNMWASPLERAAQLKRQQKVLREQAWNAKPEYEKRNVVLSLDVAGGKVTKKISRVEKPRNDDRDDDDEIHDGTATNSEDAHAGTGGTTNSGTFSKNPLLGNLIRPIWNPKGKSVAPTTTTTTTTEEEGEVEAEDNKENQSRQGFSAWRRVQDDDDDNEAWILDGGLYGGGGGGGGSGQQEDDDDGRRFGDEERACG